MTRTFATAGAPHVPSPHSVHRMMRDVLLALLPGIAAHVWFFGIGLLVQIALAVSFALALEWVMLTLRRKPTKPFLTDLSAPLTGVLYCLCLPPLMPWWTVFIGMFFAIVIAKHLYGGLGYNIFNPAMVGYAVILISFPLQATSWLPPAELAQASPGLVESIRIVFGAAPAAGWDAITQATPLDLVRTASEQGVMMSEVVDDPIFGDFGGRGWEWIANCYVLGGIYLLYRKTISWHVPVALLGTVLVLTVPGWLINPDANPLPLAHIFSGGMLLGAFFIATDPVSGSTTPRGRLMFGAGVALIALAIRRWGGYPDGIAFAILLMNMLAPLLDRWTKPRVFGHA